jgi:hypothetical protein
LDGLGLLIEGYRLIILFAIVSPVSSASNPQSTFYANDARRYPISLLKDNPMVDNTGCQKN